MGRPSRTWPQSAGLSAGGRLTDMTKHSVRTSFLTKACLGLSLVLAGGIGWLSMALSMPLATLSDTLDDGTEVEVPADTRLRVFVKHAWVEYKPVPDLQLGASIEAVERHVISLD